MRINQTGVQAITAPADQREKAGFFTTAAGAVVSSATVAPHGLILDGGDIGGTTSIAPCAGGVPGSMSVKLNGTPGTIVKGSRLALVNDGTVKLDPGTGARVIVAEAQEAGTADELVEAVLISPPIVFAS